MDTPLNVAVMVGVTGVFGGIDVVMNVAEEAPAATRTEAGTVITSEFTDRSTVWLMGAGPESVTEQFA